MKVYFLLNGL